MTIHEAKWIATSSLEMPLDLRSFLEKCSNFAATPLPQHPPHVKDMYSTSLSYA